jgi:hypothetical protein
LDKRGRLHLQELKKVTSATRSLFKSLMSNKTGNVRITLRRVRETLLPWKSNKYYLLVCVCMRACSLANPARNAYTPYCDVTCDSSVSTNFSTLTHKWCDFRGKKVVEYKMCFDFLYNFFCLKHVPFCEEFIAILSKMSKRLHVMYPLLLSDFNEI